ncbi:MAG: hypothetical protein ACFFBH_01240 [Promethearchaeota archaeon]
MEEFLKQIQLSEYAIKIYIDSLGRKPLSSNELYSLIPIISQQEFLKVIKELEAAGLLLSITPQRGGDITQYLVLPPFNPIVKYLTNVNANLGSIKNQLHQLLANSLSKLFKDNKLIELNTILNASQDIRNDIQEETIIQKQEVEDIVKGMENFRMMEEVLDDLHQTIIKVINSQFQTLNKTLLNIKKDILNELELLGLKKYEKEVKMIVEDAFNKKINNSINKFAEDLHGHIEEEINKKIESLNNIIESSLQFRDDFKMLLINTINGFELKMTSIFDLIKKKKELLSRDLEEFQESIIKNLDRVIKNSVDSVAALSNPINNVMNDFKKIFKPENIQMNNLWVVNSILKVNEEVQNLVKNSKTEILLIIPKLEDNLIFEEFKPVSRNVKVKVASSEAFTNSSVRKLKEIQNFEYRTLKNDNLFIVKSNTNYLIIGISVTESKDKLNNFIGIGTNYKPFIELLNPIIDSFWTKAVNELHQAPKYFSTTKPIKTDVTNVNILPKALDVQDDHPNYGRMPKAQPPQEIPLNYTAETNLPQQVQQHSEFISKVTPKALDESSMLINNAFNILIQKLGTLKGEEFSIELQKVADLILETKGFSVTLHKLRSMINKYKEQLNLLTPDNVREIMINIEEWKTHIL